mmetsp:Transcript_13649/g.39877  ORF Transcript_13649/g.39877 Transcript_13649/m.39877 type:complete len:124 (-) Transcript_13649:144-515(-)
MIYRCVKCVAQKCWYREEDAFIEFSLCNHQLISPHYLLRLNWKTHHALWSQNPSDKREIICDDALKAVMGGKSKVTMFTMNKFISPHMIEKVDKSEYVHEDEDSDSSSEDDSGSEDESEDESG